MRMLIHFGVVGAGVALALSFMIVALCGAGSMLWVAVASIFAAGNGWLIWTILAIAGTGFLGGVIFPFVIPPPKDQREN